jgi:hypothetical protein
MGTGVNLNEHPFLRITLSPAAMLGRTSGFGTGYSRTQKNITDSGTGKIYPFPPGKRFREMLGIKPSIFPLKQLYYLLPQGCPYGIGRSPTPVAMG